MTYAETIKERGNYRARIINDEDAEAPEFFAGDPIFDLRDGALRYGGHTADDTGVHYTVERVGQVLREKVIPAPWAWRGDWDRETFERYISIFHGGTVEWVDDDRETRYVAVALPEYRRSHGCTGDYLTREPESAEWVACVEGDVWGVVVEERVIKSTEVHAMDGCLICESEEEGWEEVDSCWGYYGREYAIESAEEMLGHYAKDHTTR